MTSKRRAPESFDVAVGHWRKRPRPGQVANLRAHIKPINLARNEEYNSKDEKCIDINNEGEQAGKKTASVPMVTHELAGAIEVPVRETQEGPSRGTIPVINGSASQRHALTVRDNGHIVDANGFELEDAEPQYPYPFLAVSMEAFVIVPDRAESSSSTTEAKPSKGHMRNKCDAFVSANVSGNTETYQLWKPFKCTKCDARFMRNDHLKRHNMAHTGERPFKCPMCPAAFKASDKLKHHTKAHGKQYALYKCRFCANKFVSTETRERHEQKNHADHMSNDTEPTHFAEAAA